MPEVSLTSRAAQGPAAPAQLMVGRPFLLDDAIAGRISLAPLFPVPEFVPDLVLESPPIAGHKNAPTLRNRTVTGLRNDTKLSGNIRGSGAANKKARPCVQGGLSRRLGTSAFDQLAANCFVPMAMAEFWKKMGPASGCNGDRPLCQRATAGLGWGEVTSAAAGPAYCFSTSSFASMRIARARLSKLGEVACTSAWISANCSAVPSPAMRTTYSMPG